MNSNKVSFNTGDYAAILKDAKEGDFVYFDPPYDPVNPTSNFTGYQSGASAARISCVSRGSAISSTPLSVKFLLSNSATDFIQEIYSEYEINIVGATRSINSVASKRGKVDEVLVRNYG